MPPGLISHARRKTTALPEKARERARRKFDEGDTVDWQVIAIDTRRRLVPSAEGAGDIEMTGAALMVTVKRLRAHPYLVAYQNDSRSADVCGGVAEPGGARATCLPIPNTVSDTPLVFMHPIGGAICR